LSDDSASIIDPMGLTAEEREQIWAKLDDLKKRAAETDRRIEERKENIALLIERLQRLQRRLDRYC
jgi:chromosome segregation ATPase